MGKPQTARQAWAQAPLTTTALVVQPAYSSMTNINCGSRWDKATICQCIVRLLLSFSLVACLSLFIFSYAVSVWDRPMSVAYELMDTSPLGDWYLSVVHELSGT